MKRTQVAALLAGVALGVAGVAVAVVLSREEGRQAAKRMIDKTAPVAAQARDQARQIGGRVAQTAAAQYQTLAPKAADVISSARGQAPALVGAVSNRLPWANRGETVAELD
ncbi:MAG TPA: hypothetical protein VF116_21985 [Ktedonobacterales bacterium]